MLQAGTGDPMALADARLQAASTIQQLCELYRVARASLIPKEFAEFHNLCAALDTPPTTTNDGSSGCR